MLFIWVLGRRIKMLSRGLFIFAHQIGDMQFYLTYKDTDLLRSVG
jgi:hypothetical protein